MTVMSAQDSWSSTLKELDLLVCKHVCVGGCVSACGEMFRQLELPWKLIDI